MYGLDDENYKRYLSDFDYYKIQPINGRFSKWIDDKLTMKYMLQPFDEYLPKYYYQLNNNGKRAVVTRLMDCPEEFGEDVMAIMGLLEIIGCLAAKLISGSRGDGFYKIAYSENYYYVNNILITRNEMINFIKNLDGYILTEYLFTHKDLGQIWDKTPNTLRLLTVKEDNANPQIAYTYIRFGSETTGLVDNMHAGSVAAFVDIDNGYFTNGRVIINDEWAERKLHPDTKVSLEGTLPFWGQIKETVLAICNYIPQIRLMGFDIVITNNSFKIIEINSLPAIGAHNYQCPIYTNDKCKDFFRNLINEKTK